MKFLILITLASFSVFLSTSASADRLLMAPRAAMLSTGEIKYELGVRGSNTSDNFHWLQVGLPTLELQLQRDNPADSSGEWGLGIQGQLIPGGMLLPDLSVGIRDITDKTQLGRAYYAVLGTNIPGLGLVPGTSGARVNVGLGGGSIRGLFGSVEMDTGMRLRLLAEYDSRNLNVGVDYPVANIVKLRAASLDGSMFYGIVVNIGGTPPMDLFGF